MKPWMIGVVGWTGVAGSALAADNDVSLSLRAAASHSFNADLDDDDGEVSVTRAGGGGEAVWNASSKLRLVAGFDSEVSWYDFESDAGGAFDEVIDTALTHGLSLTAIWSHTDTLSFVFFGSVNSGYETGADFGDSLTYAGGAAVGFKVNDSLSLRLGAGVRSRLEDDVSFIPVIGVEWRINETTRLTTEGLGARLIASVNDDLDVYLRAGAEWRQYRLADDNDVLPDGVLSDLRVPVGLGVIWEPAAGLQLSFEGGAVVWQEYELRDDDDEIADTNTDPAPYVGFRVSWAF